MYPIIGLKGTNGSFIGVYPEIFLMISVLFLIVFLVVLDYIFKYKFILSALTGRLTLFIFSLTFLLLLNNFELKTVIFDYLLISNYFINLIKCIVLISLSICICVSFNYIKVEKIVQYEYFLLLILVLLGIFTIASANDLITMYLAIELQSLSFYVLASIKIFSNFSTEAGLKYFILGAFSSGVLLFGSSLIYGFTGITNFYDLNLLFNNLPYIDESIYWGLILGIIFVSTGILFKLGAAPFHMWLPDVYEGIPTIVTMVFAIVPKIAIFCLFLNLGINFFFVTLFTWKQLLIVSSILSVTIGTLGALYQVKLKRLLAYSAISNIGFMLLGFSNLSIDGIFAMSFYIIVYMIISLNLFSIILILRKRINNLKFKKINELILLFKSNTAVAVIFSLILFSIAGIPPLMGFYSKFYIFLSIIKDQNYWLAILIASISVIASMYYIRLIKLMFFKVFNNWVFFFEIGKLESFIISITFFFNIYFFFYPSLFVLWVQNLTFSLFL